MSENSLVSERSFISKKFPATTRLPHIFPSSTVSPRHSLYISNMSSNVPTNEQNAAVGAGSDTDSISSLSSQAANMNLDRSSPPAVLSSEASDEEGDITIMKEDSPSEEEGPDEEGQMPFLDKHGEVSHQLRESLYLAVFILLPTNTPSPCLDCLPSVLLVMYHIIMYCILRPMYPALVKCTPVHSEFIEVVPVMCCDEISSHVSLSVFPIGHILPPVRYSLWHIHVCLLLHVLLLVNLWPIVPCSLE